MNATPDHAVVSRRVRWDDARAVGLRAGMDTEMERLYGGRISDRAAVEAALLVDPDDIVATVILVTTDDHPVAHAALRRLGNEWEVKRVVVDAAYRGYGLARLLMAELESIARQEGASRLILQTGDRQPAAVSLYLDLGYSEIPPYQPYADAIPFSRCFAKVLSPNPHQS